MHRQTLQCFFHRNLFPDNLFEATFSKSQTMHKEHKEWINSTNTTLGQAAVTLTKYVGKASGTNLLGKEHMFDDFTRLYTCFRHAHNTVFEAVFGNPRLQATCLPITDAVNVLVMVARKKKRRVNFVAKFQFKFE